MQQTSPIFYLQKKWHLFMAYLFGTYVMRSILSILTAILVVTHDDKIPPHFKSLYRLRDGIAYEEQARGLPFSD